MAGLLHVTEVLRKAGLVPTEWFTDHARERGTAVHLAIQYHHEGALDWSSLDPDVRSRMDGYLHYIADCHPVVHEVERYVKNDVLGYCGTTDQIVSINGRRGVLDVKNGGPERWHGLQLAAYARALPGPLARWNLYLGPQHPKGHRLVEATNRSDWGVFAAALCIVKWKEGQ